MLLGLVVHARALVDDVKAVHSMPMNNDSFPRKYQQDSSNFDFHSSTEGTRKHIVRAGDFGQSYQQTIQSLVKKPDGLYWSGYSTSVRTLSVRQKVGKISKRDGRHLGWSAGWRRRPVASRSVQRRSSEGTGMTNSQREHVLYMVNNLRRQVKPTAANMLFMVSQYSVYFALPTQDNIRVIVIIWRLRELS